MFGKKVECKKLFLGILSNNSCIYLYECFNTELEGYGLREYFTERLVAGWFENFWCPWDKQEIFYVDGLLAFAYPAYQVIPNELIRNGEISENTLRAMLPIFEEVLRNNTDEFNKLFNEEQEKQKEKVHKK